MDGTCSVNGQRWTATHNYEILATCDMKPQTTPQKNCRLLIELEQAMRPQTQQAV